MWRHFQGTSKEVIWSKHFLNYIDGLESAISTIFQRGLGWPCPVSAAIKNASQYMKNSFCFVCQWISRKTVCTAKLESAYSLLLKCSKITVHSSVLVDRSTVGLLSQPLSILQCKMYSRKSDYAAKDLNFKKVCFFMLSYLDKRATVIFYIATIIVAQHAVFIAQQQVPDQILRICKSF